MKILGLGVDIVNITRVDNIINYKKKKFLKKTFKNNEFKNKKINKFTVAKKFAAKEAFSKAIGTGIGKFVSFKEISVLNKSNGSPYIKITKNLEKKIEKKMKSKKIKIHLSISDDFPLAIAFVIISREI